MAAQRLVARLAENASKGEDVNLVGSPGNAASDASHLRAAGLAMRSLAPKLRPNAAARPASGPTDFELRGFAINNNRTWEVKTELDGAFCADDCETTDIIRQTWKITPQRNVDVFSFSSVYVRNAGNFSNVYADGFVLCGSTECARESIGRGGRMDGTGSGTQGIEHPSQAGKKTRDRVRLQATFKPNSTRYYDGVQTGTATCGTGSKNYCVF